MNNVQQAAAQELLRRQDALRSMWKYREYMEPSGEPDFQFPPAAHHDILINALHFLEYGQDHDGKPVRRVLVMMPPGSAKSTYSSVQFATWYFARHPDHKILACSNTTDLAEEFNRRRRNTCFSVEWQALSETQIDKNAQGVGQFQTLARGHMKAAGVGSSIVGTRADLLILDDPITSFEQAMSNSQLDKIWAWYETDARSRLLPNGKELIVTTRWARNDPAGHILDMVANGEEDWHIVRLPMLADSADDPLGRELGEPLWPEWFGQHQIDQNIKNPLRWSALYQQVPLDESGSWVDDKDIRVVSESEIPENLNIIIAMDLALSVGKGDFTVFVVAGMDHDRNIFVIDVIRRQYTPDKAANELFDLNEKYAPNAVLIDDDPAAKVFHGLFYELARKRGAVAHLTMLPLRGRDKETRAAAIRGMFRQGSVFIRRAIWNADLHAEIYTFPNGDHDDQIDCLSLIGRRLPLLSAPPRPKSPNAIKEIVFQDDAGNLILDRPLDTLFTDREDAIGRNFNRYRL